VADADAQPGREVAGARAGLAQRNVGIAPLQIGVDVGAQHRGPQPGMAAPQIAQARDQPFGGEAGQDRDRDRARQRRLAVAGRVLDGDRGPLHRLRLGRHRGADQRRPEAPVDPLEQRRAERGFGGGETSRYGGLVDPQRLRRG
jgi:hypothetical protein